MPETPQTCAILVLMRLDFLSPDRKGERVLHTDAHGRVRLPLRSRGRQLVATTVLQAPLAPGLPWRSRFATLAFQLP